MSKNKPTKWMKLDNAALIYPATMNRTWTALFRLSATLTEPIDEDIGSRAKAHPCAACLGLLTNQARLFWFYSEQQRRSTQDRRGRRKPVYACASTKTTAFACACAIITTASQ
ncbi:MAG: hypothetical protein R2912_07885 [Eubacteriales bacterium]